jgi:hypothetical protein
MEDFQRPHSQPVPFCQIITLDTASAIIRHKIFRSRLGSREIPRVRRSGPETSIRHILCSKSNGAVVANRHCDAPPPKQTRS